MLRVIARLNVGGPAQQAALLSGRRFHPERYESLLVHGRLAPGEESMADVADREGARSVYVDSLRQPVAFPHDALALRRLTAIVRAFRPHVVHTHTAKAGFLGRLAALSARPRPVIVHTFHGHVLEGYFGPARTGLYRTLERGLARVTDRLIGVSEATIDDLVRLDVAPRERFALVPLGLDLSPFAGVDARARTDARVELGVASEEILLSYVGRIVPIKRLDLLLQAVSRAIPREPRLRLAIVGDGERRPEVERLAESLGIAPRVSFLGYRRDLPRIAAASDMAVLSSDNEGTPVALMEAGAAGVPAVATRVGGVPVVVGSGCGALVPRGDATAFADALVVLAHDPDRLREMGGRARSHVLAHFSADRLIADVDALYRGLL